MSGLKPGQDFTSSKGMGAEPQVLVFTAHDVSKDESRNIETRSGNSRVPNVQRNLGRRAF